MSLGALLCCQHVVDDVVVAVAVVDLMGKWEASVEVADMNWLMMKLEKYVCLVLSFYSVSVPVQSLFSVQSRRRRVVKR
jgi:hypothetical protein